MRYVNFDCSNKQNGKYFTKSTKTCCLKTSGNQNIFHQDKKKESSTPGPFNAGPA